MQCTWPMPSPRKYLKQDTSRAMASPCDWQITKRHMTDRARYLMESSQWSDCEFTVGIEPNQKAFKAHKLFLAMASPVFEAMFFGGMAEKEKRIEILDVQPDAFKALLEYIYTDEISLQYFDQACEICYAAKKYMLPHLVEECTKYLWRDLYPKNACRAYEFARLFEEPVLMDKCLQIIAHQTFQVIHEATFEEIEHSTLKTVLSQDSLSISSELVLFDAAHRWAAKECQRKTLEPTAENKRTVLGDALFKIRYLTLTAEQFASGPAVSGLLTQDESFSLLMNISCPGKWCLPEHLSTETQPRKSPVELPLQLGETQRYTKFSCKRAIMQEPHCLNTSILDCSVTFTVDRNICVHGIEVPSQVTDIPPDSLNGDGRSMVLNYGQNGYNELLYAHLLDSDGSRLTYTHFTSRVNWNDLIEITFNRPIYVQRNKVYRIGVVLNKVGWYPMGVCTRRVTCESVFFTFCVGQPNDTLRDGLIRTIIFSY